MSLKLFFSLAGTVLAAVSPVWAQDDGKATRGNTSPPVPVPVLSADGANATTGLQAGLDAYQKGNYPAALKKLIPLANKGDATAQLRLGVMNEMGQGVPQNYLRAVGRYRQAAEQGNAEAQYRLGEMYGLGKGVPQNKKIAAEWYSKSANQGYAEAQAKVKAEEEARAAKQAKLEAKAKAREEANAQPPIRVIIYFSKSAADDESLIVAISEACHCHPVFLRQYDNNALIYEISLPQNQTFASFEKVLRAGGASLGIQAVEQDVLMQHQQ